MHGLNDTQKMLRDAARELMEKEIIPVADEYDRNHALEDRHVLKDLLDKLELLGYLGGLVPEEHGGSGMDFTTYGILLEELARAYGALAGVVGIQSVGSLLVSRMGTPRLKKEHLPHLLRGDKIICVGITEPNVGSNVVAVETVAQLDGDEYVMNGTKTWISNGSISDFCMVVTQVEEEDEAKGIGHILVERERSPYTTRELAKLGVRSFPTSEIYFDDCRVPRENILIQPGEGLRELLHLFEIPRAIMGLMAVGLSQAALDASIAYARERKQFGRPIGSFQLVQEMISDMATETECSRLLAYKALALLDEGARCDLEASMAKAYATEAAVRVTSKAIQVHGAYGLSEEYPVERYFRDARSLTIPDGATEIQKLIVGRLLLGISAFI